MYFPRDGQCSLLLVFAVIFSLSIIVTDFVEAAGSEVPVAAIDAWRRFDDRTTAGSYIVEARSDVGDGKSGRTIRTSYSRKGNKMVQLIEPLLEEGKPLANDEAKASKNLVSESSVELDISNENGFYILEEQEEDWFLGNAQERGTDLGELILTRGSVMLSFPIRIDSTNLYRLYKSGAAKFGDWTEFTDDDMSAKASFRIKIPKYIPEVGASAGSFSLIVDPANGYRINEIRWENISMTKSEITKLQYDDSQSSYFPVSSVSTLQNRAKELESTQYIEFKEVDFEAPSDEIFTLAHYGVAEPAMPTIRSWAFLYCNLLLLALISFFVYRSFDKRLKKARSE